MWLLYRSISRPQDDFFDCHINKQKHVGGPNICSTTFPLTKSDVYGIDGCFLNLPCAQIPASGQADELQRQLEDPESWLLTKATSKFKMEGLGIGVIGLGGLQVCILS